MTSLQNYLSQKSDNTAVNEVISTVAQVGKTINKLLQRGAFADILGEAGNQNVQGEEQKKLDVIANDLLLEALTQSHHCAGVASEELDDATPAHADGSLLVLFDPLDGSSNIDINMAVGTIFSILPYQRQGQTATNADFLQSGEKQLASGYLLYGPATMMAVTTGNGVAMFGYDPQQDEFLLIKDQVQIDADTKEYAINASNYRYWLYPMQRYVNELVAGKSGARGKDFNTRWVAAMVGDVHRILCRGGIFMYPFDNKDPNKAGKLRLMYEANPMSLLIEQAGGAATDATHRILTIEPNDIHQRVPVVLGSKNEVAYVQILHQQMHIFANEKITQYQWLEGMRNDSYYPPFLVDKLQSILLNVCYEIETQQPKNLDELYTITNAAVELINDLQDEFEANDSEIETVARETLGEDFHFIATAYGFGENVDIEELIADRDW